MNKATSEELIRREGEKTMMGAKVSELRLAMKKKEAAHKEDIAKLNRDLMLLRSLSNQDKARRSDLELQVEALANENESYQEQLRAEQLRLDELSYGDQDTQIQLAKLKGEIEVLRVREMQWQSLAQGKEDRPREIVEVPSKGSLAASSTVDSYIMRLFHRLLWERFSHLGPDDLAKALKMDQRSNNMPRADVDKVLKMYKNHQKTFTIAKAFRNIDVHRTGRLAAHEFELRLTQILSLDVELSGYIYRLLHKCLYPSGESSCATVETLADKSDAARSSSGRSTPQRSSTPPVSRLDSSKSIEEGMITEEQFAHVLESRRYAL